MLALLLVLACLGPPGVAQGTARPSASGGPAAAQLSLTTTSALGFAPPDPTVNSLTVTFTVGNPEGLQHTFTLSSRVNATAPQGTGTGNASGDYFAWPYLLADKLLNASQSVTFTVTFPTWGSYQFICRFHYPTMQGSVDVIPPGSPSPSSGPSLPPTWVLLVAAGAVVVAGAAVGVLLARRRARDVHPPERRDAP